eukprot:gene4288-4857_t
MKFSHGSSTSQCFPMYKKMLKSIAAWKNIVQRELKEVMCKLFWGSLREYGIGCLMVGKKPLTHYFTSLAAASTVTGIRQMLNLMLIDGKKDVYVKVGTEYVVALDVALGSGGSEAVVESFYSVM